MGEHSKAAEAIQYTGLEKTRRLWDRWVEPGEIILGPSGLVTSLAKEPDFQIVDTTLPPVAEIEDPGEGGEIED